jgi:tetratricopeptide (TPR) repeat protein
VLSTVAVNLRDCPPFASRHRAGMGKEDGDRWQALYRAGIELQDSTRWAEAMAQYEEAARIDDRFAELQFRMGESLAALGRTEEARQRLLAACDLDALRFRADRRINQAIRDVFVEREADGVFLADAEGALARGAPATGGLPGNEYFFEHVHLNFDGNYLLARALLAQVERALPQLRASPERGSVPPKQLCARALAMTPWDEHQSFRQMAGMLSHPPFSNQLGHAARMAALEEKTAVLARLSSEPESARQARRWYEAALEHAPGDWRLRHRYGNLLLAAGETQQAVAQMRIALRAYPQNLPLLVDLGVAESMNGDDQEAVALFEKALEIYPEHLVAHSNLVTALAREGRIYEAKEHLHRAIEIDPEHDDAYINLGVALDERGDTKGAIAYFRKAIEIDPANAMAHYDLGIALARQGRVTEAISSLRRALDNSPDLEAAHVNLGIALAGRGEIQEAMAHFRRALEIRPGDPAALYNLGSGLASLGRVDEAITSFRRAAEADPDHYDAHVSLGIALAQRDPQEAVAHFRKAQRIGPGNPTAYYDLGVALAGQGRFDEAIQQVRRAIEIDPGDETARLVLGQLLARRGRSDASSP